MDSKLVIQKIKNAPDDIKNIIGSMDIVDLVEDFTKINHLNPDMEVKIAHETLYVLIGLSKRSDFLNKLLTLGFSSDIAKKIDKDINDKIFSRVSLSISKLQSTVTEQKEKTDIIEKDRVLDEIENPTPAKPAFSNPAGKNQILDAQHNLPEEPKKILISSSAVPSRGPMLNSYKPGVNPIKPTAPTPTNLPGATQNPPQNNNQPTPDKYKADPYREPLE